MQIAGNNLIFFKTKILQHFEIVEEQSGFYDWQYTRLESQPI
jgi:hypothetical protein